MRKNTRGYAATPRQAEEMRYTTSRMNLLLVIAFTLLNVIRLLFGTADYFIFSASLPYVLTLFGLINTGRMPDEYYEGAEFVPYSDIYLYIMAAISFAIIIFYAVCWLMSKKHLGWIIAALVAFLIDFAAFFYFYGFDLTLFLDILFHAWVIYYLIVGIVSGCKLRNMPPDEPIAEGARFEGAGFGDADFDGADDPYAPTSGTSTDGFEATGEPSARREDAVGDDNGLFSYFEGDIVEEKSESEEEDK